MALQKQSNAFMNTRVCTKINILNMNNKKNLLRGLDAAVYTRNLVFRKFPLRVVNAYGEKAGNKPLQRVFLL